MGGKIFFVNNIPHNLNVFAAHHILKENGMCHKNAGDMKNEMWADKKWVFGTINYYKRYKERKYVAEKIKVKVDVEN